MGGAAVASASLVNPPPERPGAETAENALTTPAMAEPGETSDAGSADAQAPVATAEAPDVTAPANEGTAPPAVAAEAPVAAAETAPAQVETPAAEDTPAAVATAPAAQPAEEGAPAIADATAVDATDSAGAGADITAEVDAPAAPSETDAPGQIASADTAPETGQAPAAVAAADVVNGSVPVPETTTADQPVVAATDTLAPPQVDGESGVITAVVDDQVLPSPRAVAPSVPDEDTLDLASADTAVPPGIAPEITAEAPAPGTAPGGDDASSDVQIAADDAGRAPAAPGTPATPEGGDTTPSVETTPSPATDDATDDDATDDVASGPVGENTDVTVVTPETVIVVGDAPDQAPTVSVLPGGSNSVKVNRFGADTNDVTIVAGNPAPDPESFPEGTPAIVRYAVPAADAGDLPEMSVILVDDGSLPGAVNAVAGVSFPVSVMLSPSTPDAADKMAAYRAAGVEVGILAALPPSATPSDVAVFFEAALVTLPETVAVLDAGGETQADTDVIRETVAALAQDGRGLITVPRGLNSAQRVASESGVPAGVIFRELDGENQDARVIRRFMDQAAFRARQESGVILLGKVRAETVEALTGWSSGSRARQVAMQPVSAVLSE